MCIIGLCSKFYKAGLIRALVLVEISLDKGLFSWFWRPILKANYFFGHHGWENTLMISLCSKFMKLGWSEPWFSLRLV